MEVSSVPTEDSSITEMKTQHDDEMHKEPVILQKLRDTECSLLLERFFDSNTLLHVAASIGHDQIVETILSKQQCQQELLTARNSNGDLPLHVAANAGHLSIVQYLFSFSYEYQEQLKPENSESSDDLGSVESFIQQQQNDLTSKILRETNNEGNTPLHLASIKKYEEVDVNLKSKYSEVAEFLIKKDPSVCNYRNKASKNPRSMAKEAKDEDHSKLISDLEPEVTLVGTATWSGAKMKDQRQNINSIKKLIEKDLEHPAVSLSDKTPKLNTILHLAAAASSVNDQFVQEILEFQLCQKFVTEKNSNGDLPLHVAASAGNIQIVEHLVK